ncbi:MAG: UDPGP type 1 family protein [Phycisphaerales bacterium]|nr:MAG: UDPGP type 1 family protein [Phycisphaerales bacterium]
MPDTDRLRQRLRAAEQEHLLRFVDELDPALRDALFAQLEAIDIEAIPSLVQRYVRAAPESAAPADIEPAPCHPRDPADPRMPWDAGACRRAGEALIRAGKIAAFTVAGGQGSRLGYDGPKGCYPGGAVTEKPLFQCLADWIIAARERYDAAIPWCVMTSPLNHKATLEFFEAHDYCGLPREDVIFFSQGVLPSFDMHTGKVLLAQKHEAATNPDGHGGSLLALHASGALRELATRGVEHISYTQIDNPLVRVIDPVFIGLHTYDAASSGEMSSKMVPKAHAGEKVGVFCAAGGRVMVVEYSDMPEELSRATNPDGALRFNAGSIAVHMIGRAFIERLNAGKGFALPYHRAEKKVACVDPESGRPVVPAAPNAVKLEAFVFDAIPLCERSVVLETSRIEEFAPIKNAEGADSPETSRRVQTQRAAAWLEACGVDVPRDADGEPDCTLEISPRTAMWAEDLRAEKTPRTIERGARTAL